MCVYNNIINTRRPSCVSAIHILYKLLFGIANGTHKTICDVRITYTYILFYIRRGVRGDFNEPLDFREHVEYEDEYTVLYITLICPSDVVVESLYLKSV